MYQNPYIYNPNFNGSGNSFPNDTLLGGNNINSSRPRPMYNVRPEHNLPTYGLDFNQEAYKRNDISKKVNKIMKEITEYYNEREKPIIIVII